MLDTTKVPTYSVDEMISAHALNEALSYIELAKDFEAHNEANNAEINKYDDEWKVSNRPAAR